MHDILCIGAGPSNLSLAALSHPVSDVDLLTLEQSEDVEWYRSLQFFDSRMQSSFIEDLVSIIDPTSQFSFLNYLSEKGLLVPFLCMDSTRVTRRQFEKYLQWAAGRLDCCIFNQRVTAVSIEDGAYRVDTATETFHARNVVVGTGFSERRPDWFIDTPTVVQAKQYAASPAVRAAHDIVVVGGGQTAAEILLNMLQEQRPLRSLRWILNTDVVPVYREDPFSNEVLFPPYFRSTIEQPVSERSHRVQRHSGLLRGLSPETSKDLYAALADVAAYGETSVEIYTDFEIESVSEFEKTIQCNGLKNGESMTVSGDVLISCVGFRSRGLGEISLSGDIQERLLDVQSGDLNAEELQDRARFRIFDGRRAGLPGNIYANNGGSPVFGDGEFQLCSSAWRAATILSDIMQKPVYKLEGLARSVVFRH